MITVPLAAIELARRFEGFHRVPRNDPGRAHPYRCPAGFWTIGYGHLCDATHPPITGAEAEDYLARDLNAALAATLRHCPVLTTEPESRLAAIVDFTFNLGGGRLRSSTLRRRVNQRNWPAAAAELRRWVYGGGKVLPGLVARRSAEITLLLMDYSSTLGSVNRKTAPLRPVRLQQSGQVPGGKTLAGHLRAAL